jgi:hypothetical protein
MSLPFPDNSRSLAIGTNRTSENGRYGQLTGIPKMVRDVAARLQVDIERFEAGAQPFFQ